MKCEHAQEFLSEYVTGEMDRALAVSLENHLIVCAPCTETVEGLRRLWHTLDDMPVIEPPLSFHAAVMDRIAAEQIQVERAARPAVRVPAWRGLLQPRVFAYAAVAIVLLLGAEFVQVQRAALGPLGLVLNVVRPVPALKHQSVEWKPNGLGGGTLMVSLQAHAQVNGAGARRQVRVELKRPELSSAGPVAMEADINSDRPTVLEMPVSFTPDSTLDTLTVTVSSTDASMEDPQTLSLPLPPAGK